MVGVIIFTYLVLWALGFGKISISPLYIGPGTWKNSDLFSYILWALGFGKNSDPYSYNIWALAFRKNLSHIYGHETCFYCRDLEGNFSKS